MTHEPKCIYPVTCTCVSILRERINSLNNEISMQNLKISSLEGKIQDGISCCCSGCASVNRKLHDEIIKGMADLGVDKITID